MFNAYQNMKQSQRFFFFSLGVIMFLALSCSPGEKQDKSSSNDPIVLDPHAFKSKLEETPEAVLIDVRTPEEVAESSIDGAINIDYQDPEFAQGIDTLDRDKEYFVYCLSGKRSADAIKDMQKAGFQNITTLKDGFRNWKEQGLGTSNPALKE
jgi:rhodanese-related sulfurtransferase